MTANRATGTDGGDRGTSGIASRTLLLLLVGLAVAYALVQTVANVYSILADHETAGDPAEPIEIWLLEGTSLVAWLAMGLAIWWAVARLRPPRLSWPVTILAHLGMTVVVSLGHVALMGAMRMGIWGFAGEHYGWDRGVAGELLYEFRKDFATYVEIALIFALIQWLVARYAERSAATEPAMLAVQDGAVTHRIPVAEIDHVRSAGNYVELAWRGRIMLNRATLASIESFLADHGFIRIHRTRLVRRTAIRRVEVKHSGDYEVELESGERLKGSRRHRAAIDRSE